MRVVLEGFKGFDTSNSLLSIILDSLSEGNDIDVDHHRFIPSIAEFDCSSRCGAYIYCAKDHRAENASVPVLLPNSVCRSFL
jgi:hypothetical protein